MEEDLGSEDRQRTALIAEPLQEHREHEQIRVVLAPSRREGSAMGLYAGEFGRKRRLFGE